MTDQKHCPFLNRADPRCSSNFSLDRLDHAFEYCFNQYQQCPVYLELLLERRVRQLSSAAHPTRDRVQLTIPHRQAQHAV